MENNPNPQHLPHEAWHVVQKKMVRVTRPTGAQFFAYISNPEKTDKWKIEISQGDWSGELSNTDPEAVLQSPGLQGEFQVSVWASGPALPYKKLENDASQSGPNVECSINCTSMVLIYATNDKGTDAKYYTTADAYCGPS